MQANPRHLILNLLLSTDGTPLAAREAVASCALFGVRENSTRVALARLASAGLIESAGRSSYRLGPNAAQVAGDVATWRDAERRVRDWAGGWIAVTTGALSRSDRAVLRARHRALGMLGLEELEPGLHVRPDNLVGGAAAARARLLTLGLDAAACVFVAHDFDAAREQRARGLWDGAALNTRYRASSARLDVWLAKAGTLAPEAAAREAFQLGNDAIRDLVFDPQLPEPLVDVAARRAFVDAVIRFDAAGHAIWNRFFAGLRQSAPQPAARARTRNAKNHRHLSSPEETLP